MESATLMDDQRTPDINTAATPRVNETPDSKSSYECRRWTPATLGRLATLGLIALLLLLFAASSWAAVATHAAASRMTDAGTISDAYFEAGLHAVTEESLDRLYRLEPSEQVRAQHQAAAAGFLESMDLVRRKGSAEDIWRNEMRTGRRISRSSGVACASNAKIAPRWPKAFATGVTKPSAIKNSRTSGRGSRPQTLAAEPVAARVNEAPKYVDRAGSVGRCSRGSAARATKHEAHRANRCEARRVSIKGLCDGPFQRIALHRVTHVSNRAASAITASPSARRPPLLSTAVAVFSTARRVMRASLPDALGNVLMTSPSSLPCFLLHDPDAMHETTGVKLGANPLARQW